MAEAFANWLQETFGGVVSLELLVLFISMLPILELRGGMVAAAIFGIPVWEAFLICIIGNLLPIPFILWLITPIFDWMKKRKIFRGLVEKLEKRASGEKSQQIRKFEFWGLMAFVGIPLPGTGAWTGCLIAALLNMDKKRALLAAVLGVLIASVIMGLFSYGLLNWIISLF